MLRTVHCNIVKLHYITGVQHTGEGSNDNDDLCNSTLPMGRVGWLDVVDCCWVGMDVVGCCWVVGCC